MITCDCEVYEICPSCAPSEPTYAKAAAAHNEVVKKIETDEKQHALEHPLAATFVALQDERNPEKRQALWFECLRLSAEWKKLNATNTEKVTDTNEG